MDDYPLFLSFLLLPSFFLIPLARRNKFSCLQPSRSFTIINLFPPLLKLDFQSNVSAKRTSDDLLWAWEREFGDEAETKRGRKSK